MPVVRYTSVPGTCPAYLRVSTYQHWERKNGDALNDYIEQQGGVSLSDFAAEKHTSTRIVEDIAAQAGITQHKRSYCKWYDEGALAEAWRDYGPKDGEMHANRAKKLHIATEHTVRTAVAWGLLQPKRTLGGIAFYDEVEMLDACARVYHERDRRAAEKRARRAEKSVSNKKEGLSA